jgi:hypothetical protein
MRYGRISWLGAALSCSALACGDGGTLADPVQPDPAGADAPPPDTAPIEEEVSKLTASSRCDLTGTWIVAQETYATALSAQQTSVNWFYHEIEQDGVEVTIRKSLNCGLRVTGSTTVTLSDAALVALARNTSSSVGRTGIFGLSSDGTRCQLALARTYNIRGANKQRFLTDHWQLGAAPKPLAEFPRLPASEAEGMEDWDNDGREGYTLSTGFGDRYVAQRDWNEHHGPVELDADEFGTRWPIAVVWDGEEVVSAQTPAFLRATATPVGNGRAYYRRADDLAVANDGPTPELTTCKNVQRLALQAWPPRG